MEVQIVSNLDTTALDRLLSSHQDIASHLCKRSSEDQAYDVSQISLSEFHTLDALLQSARELTAAVLGLEFASALKQINIWISEPDEDTPRHNHQKLLQFGQRLKHELRDVWKDHTTDVFDIGFVVPLFIFFHL
jgi:cohesin loading factor subunit SCC2